MPQTIELTSKPIKLWLALTSAACLVSFCGMVYSFGEPSVSTEHWFLATVVTFIAYRICRAARWWVNG